MKLRNKTDKYFFKETNSKISMFHPSGYAIPDEEPILIFRAKDLGVLAAISAYLEMLCEQDPSSTIKDHLMSMLDVTENIRNYQSQENIQSITCSLKAHKKTIKYLNKDIDKAIELAKDTLRDIYGEL